MDKAEEEHFAKLREWVTERARPDRYCVATLGYGGMRVYHWAVEKHANIGIATIMEGTQGMTFDEAKAAAKLLNACERDGKAG